MSRDISQGLLKMHHLKIDIFHQPLVCNHSKFSNYLTETQDPAVFPLKSLFQKLIQTRKTPNLENEEN